MTWVVGIAGLGPWTHDPDGSLPLAQLDRPLPWAIPQRATSKHTHTHTGIAHREYRSTIRPLYTILLTVFHVLHFFLTKYYTFFYVASKIHTHTIYIERMNKYKPLAQNTFYRIYFLYLYVVYKYVFPILNALLLQSL